MAKRTYETEAIRVFWDSDRCAHTGICLRMQPDVFDRERRPWVDVSAADVDAIAETIERCPSGALRYERLDGEPGESFDETVTVVPWPNGPLLVRGRVRVETRRGEVLREENRMTLCRCGSSENMPFCDYSHAKAGFKNTVRAVPVEKD